MKKIYFIVLPLILVCMIAGSSVYLQTKKETEKPKVLEGGSPKNEKQEKQSMSGKDMTCKTCHEGDYPSKNDPMLRLCPREHMLSDYKFTSEGPDVVEIKDMSENYEGVIFSHKVHSQMSEVSNGCAGCHHYNTSGPVLACGQCHEKERFREDVSVPDLKAAYHRQCLTCHKQWSRENGCNTQCHATKGTDPEKIRKPLLKLHPQIQQPGKLVWETNSEEGKIVTFYHDEHNKVFNIKCTTCHNNQNCSKCHPLKKDAKTEGPIKVQKSFEEHHMACVDCHAGAKCNKCHGESERAPFNHSKTGFALTKQHSNLACAKCHGSSMPFKKLDRNCASCHSNFVMGKFDHRKAGLVLDDIHKEVECKSCHKNNDFGKNPDCRECHDDKSFPKDLPGKR
jgi:hypothetical protein